MSLSIVGWAKPALADQWLVQQSPLGEQPAPGFADDRPPAAASSGLPAIEPPPPPQPPAALAEDFEGQRDPTVPSPEILELLQPRRQDVPGAPPTRAAISPLPLLPEFQLKAIVLTDGSRGTALLVADQRPFSVPLGRGANTSQVDFPPRQFWQYRDTLARIDEALADAEPPAAAESLPVPKPTPGVRLDGFSIDGIFFAVEDFSDRTVLLRAYPHDVLILVQ